MDTLFCFSRNGHVQPQLIPRCSLQQRNSTEESQAMSNEEGCCGGLLAFRLRHTTAPDGETFGHFLETVRLIGANRP